MPSSDWLTIRVRLQDAAKTQAQLTAIGGEVKTFGNEAEVAGKKTAFAAEKNFLLGESLYSLRRYGFYAITGLGLTGAAVVKMGYDFDEAKASGTDALAAIVGGVRPAAAEMGKLVNLTHDDGMKLTDLTTGARNLLTFGFSLKQTNAYLKTFGAYAAGRNLGAGGLASLTGIFGQIKDTKFFTSRQAMALRQLGVPANQALIGGLHLNRGQSYALQHGQLEVPASYALPVLANWLRTHTPKTKSLGEQINIGKSWISQIVGGIDQPLFAGLEKQAPKINAWLARIGKGYSSGGAKGMFNALDPSGTAANAWLTLTHAVKITWLALKGAWTVAKPVVAVFLLMSDVVLALTSHVWPLKIALGSLIVAYVAHRAAMIAWIAVTKVQAAWLFISTTAVKLYELWILRAEYATLLMTKAQWLLNVAMDANPVGLIIVGIAALAVGFYLLYTRVTWFRNAVNSAWLLIRRLYTWIKTHALTISLDIATGGLFSVGKGAFSITKHVIHGLASGGNTVTAGSVMVGERGPELLNLPAGARVTPLSSQPGGFGGQSEWFIDAMTKVMERIQIQTAAVKVNGQKIGDIAFDAKATSAARA